MGFRVSWICSGSPERAAALARALAGKGFEPELVLADPPGLHPGIEGIATHCIAPGLAGLPAALSWLKHRPPDLLAVESEPGSGTMVAAHALAGRPCPLVVTVTGSRPARTRLLRSADRILCHSSAIARGLPNAAIVPAPVVQPDFPERMRKRADHCWLDNRWSAPVVLSSGVPGEGSDFATLLRAAARIKARVIVLDESDRDEGPPHRHLRQLARALDVRMDLLTYVADPLPLMARAPVFAAVDVGEGLPVSLIQAMACRCPIVGLRAPGTTEMLKDGRLAPMAPAGDDGALAEALAAVLAHEPDTRPLAARAAEHSAEASAEAYATVFDSLVNGSSRRNR